MGQTTNTAPGGLPAQTLENLPRQITFGYFRDVEMLVGEIKTAEAVPKADKLLKLIVDFGSRGVKVVVAGIAKSFPDPSTLVGKRLGFVTNLEPRKMMGIESEAMLLAAKSASDPERVVLMECLGAEVGSRLS